MNDHGGFKKAPVCGYRQDGIEFGGRQSRQKPRAQRIGKAKESITRQEFTRAIHNTLLAGREGSVIQ